METWLTNPITLFFRWFFTKLFLEIKYLKKHLRLEYMVEIKNCTFGSYNTIYKYSRLKSSSFGDFTYVARDAQVHYTKIGKFSCIGPNVSTGMGAHPASTFVSSHPLFYSTRGQAGGKVIVDKTLFDEYQETIIGHDVWIGANALIKYGVTIGDGAIIAAGAVVTKDVEAYSIIGGVPAKFIKYRFEPDKGIYDAMNKGLNLASGEYVLFMNSGDEIYSTDTVTQVFAKADNADIYYGETELINESLKSLGRRKHKTPEHFTWKSFKYGMNVGHQAIYVKREITDLYDINYKLSADIDWVLKAAFKAKTIVNTRMYVAKFLVGGASKQRHLESLKERYQIFKNYYGFFPNLLNHAIIVFRLVFNMNKNKKANN